MQKDTIIHGDALKVLEEIDEKSVDLVYLDPPFLPRISIVWFQRIK